MGEFVNNLFDYFKIIKSTLYLNEEYFRLEIDVGGKEILTKNIFKNWIVENCNRKVILSDNIGSIWIFHFSDECDLMAFKLWWL